MHKILKSGNPSAKKALIALHGRGGSASNILTLAKTLCDDTFYLVAPEAENNSWYPYNFMSADPTNSPSVDSAVNLIKQLIDNLKHIHEIYLMGFSQGACLSLEVAARHPQKYGGIIAFSGGLIGPSLKTYPGNLEGTKVFIGISTNDPHIPLQRSKDSYELLKKMGADATIKIYEGASHTIIQDEIDWVKSQILT